MAGKSPHNLPPGIHRDKNGAYWATLVDEHAMVWRERYPGRTKPKRKASTLKEALKLQRGLVDDLLAARDPQAHNPTVSAWVEEWVAGRHKIKPATKRRYGQSHRFQIKPLRLGRLRLRQLTRQHVRDWVNELKRMKRQDDPSRTLDPYTIRNAFATLRAALNGAVSDGLLATNPCLGVELPRPDNDEISPLTPDEVNAFLHLVDNYELDKATKTYRPHRLAALYHTAIKAGLREGELLGLRWADVDLDRRELRVTGQQQQGERTSGKTKRAHRAVPLSASLVAIFHDHARNQVEERAISGSEWNKAELVFCSENGTPLSASNTWRTFTALQRRAGLADPCEACEGVGKMSTAKGAPPCEACDGHGVIARYRFHDLRHTYAALSLAAGIELFTLSRRMGHSSISVTADRYGHLYTGNSDDAEALDQFIKKKGA